MARSSLQTQKLGENWFRAVGLNPFFPLRSAPRVRTARLGRFPSPSRSGRVKASLDVQEPGAEQGHGAGADP